MQIMQVEINQIMQLLHHLDLPRPASRADGDYVEARQHSIATFVGVCKSITARSLKQIVADRRLPTNKQ